MFLGWKQIKYLFFGTLFGLLFPIIAWGYEFYIQELTIVPDSFKIILKNNSILLVVSAVPIFLGLFSLFTGRNKAKLEREKENISKMKNLLYDKSINLESTNEILKSKLLEHKLKQNKIKKLAYQDYLTGVPNKLFLLEKLQQLIIQEKYRESLFAIMFLDLDNYKVVNDTYGHSIGDKLLKAVATRLSDTLRKNDTIARIGGDEFILVFEEIDDVSNIEIIARKICDAFTNCFTIENKKISMSVSIGISIFPLDGNNVDTIIKNADMAMYYAKKKGKNKHVLCTPKLKMDTGRLLELTQDIYYALSHNELFIEYQPQMCTNTGKIIGLEALLRWQHPKLGIITPNEFIPLAEQEGLIQNFGEWVLRTVCMQNNKWHNKGCAMIRISVNLSIQQLILPGIEKQVSDILNETQIDPKYLELEITERVALIESNSILQSLNSLKKLGIIITVDDFGTGYSALSYLKRLPVDKIKIDKSFVDGIGINNKDEVIIKSILLLANGLDISVIAEGVETNSQLDFLKKNNCEEIQGYFYYKSLKENKIEKLLKENKSLSQVHVSSFR